jgi:hypothetical protein
LNKQDSENTMNARANPILIGIVAGLAAAVFMAASPYLPLVFQLAAITALFVAGLGFGRVAGLVAVATTAMAIGALASSWILALMLGLTLLPAAVMSHLASLARPASEIGGPEATLAWYPLSDILLTGAILTALSIACIMMLQPLDELFANSFDEATRILSQSNPNIILDAEIRTRTIAMLRATFPIAQGMGNMVVLFAGFYFAMRILAALGRNIRPREDVRTSLRTNRLSVAMFLAGIVLMFAGDRIAVIGASVTGAIAGNCMLAGYALIHEKLRDQTWAIPGLVLTYLLSPLTIFLAVGLGLANPRRAIALTPTKPNHTPTNQP